MDWVGRRLVELGVRVEEREVVIGNWADRVGIASLYELFIQERGGS